jgi:hypothetical protein
MTRRRRLLDLTKRDATVLFWANSARYGFWLTPRIAHDAGQHSLIFDARWLCFGVNIAFVDEDGVTRGAHVEEP